jgi:hypothetical protein
MEAQLYQDTSLMNRIENAVEHLACGTGNLRDRLIAGCVANLEFLNADDFPEELRPLWIELQQLLSQPDPNNWPMSRQYGLYHYNLHTMSGSAKRRCARIIFSSYRKLARYPSPTSR